MFVKPPINRIFWLLAALVAAPPTAWSAPTEEDMDRARKLLQSALIVDGHNDLPWVIREKLGGDAENHDLSSRTPFDTDIPRLRKGMVGAQFWSVYVPSSLSPLEAIVAQLEQIDTARRMIALYPEDFMLATSVADIEAANRTGRIASLLGAEGAHTIVNSLGVLRSYYDLGVRYMTLTHFHSNDWADSATGEARHDGLTEFGREVVREMNRLGMIADLSHVSPATMADVLDEARAPVIFSHSSARALTNHPRNVPDDILKRLKENGGVVMVTFIPPFVNEKHRLWAKGMEPAFSTATTEADYQAIAESYRREKGPPPVATLEDVADHIEHVARVAGFDHVGIGSDFYGQSGDDLVSGLEDVSRFPHLIAELASRGWSDESLAKLTRLNVLRVFSDVESAAARLRQERSPSLKTIEMLDKVR